MTTLAALLAAAGGFIGAGAIWHDGRRFFANDRRSRQAMADAIQAVEAGDRNQVEILTLRVRSTVDAGSTVARGTLVAAAVAVALLAAALGIMLGT